MKAPTEKTNDTIQIVISRSCDLFWCSNCTQLLPFRHDAVHMDPAVFRLALRSLADWPGIRGIFGGNPCMHPQFPELMRILCEEVPEQRQRGIWTNDLRAHGPLIRRVFFPHGRFNLNAHANPSAAAVMDQYLPGKVIPTSRARPSWHAPILLDWRDLGLTPGEWVTAREACDINRSWSAAIFERDGAPFAYFCEVAGALDGIRGQNHGIPAVPDWWKASMAGFGDQVAQCCDQGCGVPLRRLGNLDTAATYDYSRSFVPLIAGKLPSRHLLGILHTGLEAPATERPTDYQGLRSAKP